MREKSLPAEQAVSWEGAQGHPHHSHIDEVGGHQTTTAVRLLDRLQWHCFFQSQPCPWRRQPTEVWRDLASWHCSGSQANCPLAQPNPWDSKGPDRHRPQQQKPNRKMPYSSPRHGLKLHTAGMALEDLRSPAVVAMRGRKRQPC